MNYVASNPKLTHGSIFEIFILGTTTHSLPHSIPNSLTFVKVCTEQHCSFIW